MYLQANVMYLQGLIDETNRLGEPVSCFSELLACAFLSTFHVHHFHAHPFLSQAFSRAGSSKDPNTLTKASCNVLGMLR